MVILAFHFMEFFKDVTAYGNLDCLLHVMLYGQEYGTVMGSSVIDVDVARLSSL